MDFTGSGSSAGLFYRPRPCLETGSVFDLYRDPGPGRGRGCDLFLCPSSRLCLDRLEKHRQEYNGQFPRTAADHPCPVTAVVCEAIDSCCSSPVHSGRYRAD